MTLTLSQGRDIVKYARSVIESYYSSSKASVPESLLELFAEPRGVFVTLHKKNHELRGCIGLPEPVMPLGEAVEDAALSSALEDPRFPPVEENELKDLIIEVSVLTKPELIEVKDPRNYVNEVKVGRDGLIVEKSSFKGLLLPQVPVEWKWDTEEFLCQTCGKAGLSPDSWLVPGTKVYRFSAQVFSEERPAGTVVEKKL